MPEFERDVLLGQIEHIVHQAREDMKRAVNYSLASQNVIRERVLDELFLMFPEESG